MTVYSALRSYRVQGIVLWHYLGSMEFCLRSLKDAVRLSTTYRALRTPAIKSGSIQSLLNIIAKMEAALVRLSHEGVWETKVREQRIRDALRKLDKRLASADVVSTKEIKEWCSIFPGLELEVSSQIERLATTIWLSRIYDQTWEIRYRSTAPGKPLRLVIACMGFPDRDLLEECYKLCGKPKELYVAAVLPRWRVVWKLSMEDFLF